MFAKFGQLLIILSIDLASSLNVTGTTLQDYQVTENVIDIPDDRPLAHILPNYGLITPLNIANSTSIDKPYYRPDYGIEKPLNTNITSDKPGANVKNGTSNLKKNSFSLLHIKVETDDNPQKNIGGIKRVFNDIKDYLFNIKKGVVDGLHNFFHKNDESAGRWKNNDNLGGDDDDDIEERFNDEYDDDFRPEFERY